MIPVIVGGNESAWPTSSTEVPEVACDDQEVKNQVKCCVADVGHYASYREMGKHSSLKLVKSG